MVQAESPERSLINTSPPDRTDCKNAVFSWLACLVSLLIGTVTHGQGTVPKEEAPAPMPPADAARLFKLPKGFDVSLVVSEPEVSQPLSITFDDRGRMWVLQYLQFPNPNGLKAIKIDNWLRTKYDKMPEPPPKGPKGRDRISIYEDSNGDGTMDRVKHFLSDLNLASGMALGHGGVFVVQPPYLLFYRDTNRDDVPDGDPEVLLTGFGMDDAHAFANSLTWGPDGWLYGAQGSTATANIGGIGFQQGIWRYHPLTKEFELFAEGGGNTWGIDFDPLGNLFAGGNTVEPLVHHVQGAYYVKGFGKHGPLHNPHTYGYFQPVKHHGYAGDSLTGGFVLYQGGGFPDAYRNACIAPNTRHSAMRWSTLEGRGTSFATRAVDDFMTTRDIWFRPVDSIVGPDGALYVADWYDYNISHSSPKNRSEWYQPSRNDGRIWRVAYQGMERMAASANGLSTRGGVELTGLLNHPNAWYAREARRILSERRDPAICKRLVPLLESSDQRLALQALWSIYVSGGWTESIVASQLSSPHEYVRVWTVRLEGDARRIRRTVYPDLLRLAHSERSAVVRSQLACTAKRLDAEHSIPLVAELIGHDEDAGDIHIPLLLWWAIEDKAVSNPAAVLSLFESGSSNWNRKIAEQFLIERLARRYASEANSRSLLACVSLLNSAPTPRHQEIVLDGMVSALSGRSIETVPPTFVATLKSLFDENLGRARTLELLVRSRHGTKEALEFINDEANSEPARISLIRALGEIGVPDATDFLIELLSSSSSGELQRAVLASLGYFEDARVATGVLKAYQRLDPKTRLSAIDLLVSRPRSATVLVNLVHDGKIDRADISVGHAGRVTELGDAELTTKVEKIWGKIQPATALEKQGRISAVTQALGRARGDIGRGAILYKKHCATCHKLHGEGTEIGPDLTGAERRDRNKLVANIVDPSAVVRQEYIAHIVATKDGRTLTGLLAESTPERITLLDAKNARIVLNRSSIETLSESTQSLMPEKMLDLLTDQEVRDLIAFIQNDPK